jgi:outer membrane protein OmpA-like peptidoglycan-associated protein
MRVYRADMPELVRLLPALLIAGFAAPALAEAPPSYFALPDGVSATNVEYLRYFFLEIGYHDSAGKFAHIEPHGRFWRVQFPVPKGAKPSVLEAALRAKGWEVSDSQPILVARHTQAGHETWLLSSWAGSVAMVEKSAPQRIELVPPGQTPEELVKDQDAPYLTPFFGLKRSRWSRVEDGACDVRNPVLKEVQYAGPPRVEILYSGPRETSGVEIQEAYVDALTRAGWDVVSTGRGNNTNAHYAKQGRDLWLHFAPGNGYLSLCIADVGAASATAKLKQALDEIGHVALYGIYFDVDKATLRPEAEAALAQIRALLVKYADLKLEIQGHTDNSGTHEHNQTLSEERAESVRAWLVAHTIDGARLTTAGYSETKPVAPNTTPEGKQKNRRVELAKR